MNYLLNNYMHLFKTFDGNVFEIFEKFYHTDLRDIESWLEHQFEKSITKNDFISNLHRQKGNTFYAKKDLIKSREMYTRSLCFATPYSKEYGLALANRSAVSFEMKEFPDCLKDIELCFKTNYPTELKLKIYIRKAECYHELKQKELSTKCVSEIIKFLDSENIPLKEKVMARLRHIDKLENTESHSDHSEHASSEIPDFPDGESKCLTFASRKIKMSYSKEKGRHIVASANIQKGDILFIEKAFIFAPIFNHNKELHFFKCYECLKDVMSSVPCNLCTICVYCDENCRDLSWERGHRWECNGMQANIWFDLGIAFPAFKAMIKGAWSGLSSLECSFEDDTKCFGDKVNNYRYFDRLISNLYKDNNTGSFIVMATTVILYLEKYTDFFHWFIKQPYCPKKDLKNLVKYVGSIITKHIAQMVSNSSNIEHWTCSSPDLLLPDVLITVACGIFPTVSIMNHSCRPNVTNYFICDAIVVTALEDIPQNEEVFNCYGIDYRQMVKEERQFACKKLYHFECKCNICSDPTNEIGMLDSYLCVKCKGMVPENNSIMSSCLNCGSKYTIKQFRKINDDAQKALEANSTNGLELLVETLKIRENILYKYHKDFEEIYYKLYSFYVVSGDAENMFKYFHLWLENEKAHRGGNSRNIGTKLYEAALAILHCLQNSKQKNCSNLINFLRDVENMIKEAKSILNLYYPASITNKLNKKIEFISTK